jgi:hypothetical protein
LVVSKVEIHGRCPACLGLFRLTGEDRDTGLLYRHGFGAHFPYGRHSGGFHTNACIGTSVQRIGTAAGNRFAVKLANTCIEDARHLLSLPPHTMEDALNIALHEARMSIVMNRRRRGQEPLAAGDYAKPEDFANTSSRLWFTPESLDYRRQSLDKQRRQRAVGLRDHARALRKAVVENPS